MNIGLIDVDGHNFPNLALMKISAYHKSIGDNVMWADIGKYDITYMSKVFTFTSDYSTGLGYYGDVIRGGTGYNIDNKLPMSIDRMSPDYSIYPKYREAYGFLTRGCPNNCSWCVVPRKEGKIAAYMDIEEFLQGRKSAIIMDNNILAHEHGLNQIEKIVKLGIKVDFNQGLDARIISSDKEIAKLLARVKWLNPLRMACDTKSQMPHIQKATEMLRQYGCKPTRYFVYLLVKDIADALERAEFLRGLGLDPFAQPYRDFKANTESSKEQRRFARWVNHKAVFNTVEYKNYKH